MFWHDKHGLVTSHTEAEFDNLEYGEAFCRIPFDMCLDAAWHMEEGKPYSTFPRCALTRAEACAILTHYHRGLL